MPAVPAPSDRRHGSQMPTSPALLALAARRQATPLSPCTCLLPAAEQPPPILPPGPTALFCLCNGAPVLCLPLQL